MWAGILLFLFRLGARRRLRFDLGSPAGVANLNGLAGTEMGEIPHPDTLAYFMKGLPPDELAELGHGMVEELLRSRALEQARLGGRYYTVAADGTGLCFFRERHCEHCLTKELHGRTVYYHNVLEMKLVTPNGFAFSIATEFIQNTDGATKQDCELAAFYRLIPRFRKRFPMLQVCLLLDGLFLNQNVMRLLKTHRLHYIITFKEGSLPTAYSEFHALHKMVPNQSLRRHADSRDNAFRWLNGLVHEDLTFNALECVETVPRKNPTTFFWATDLAVSEKNVVTLSQNGGRCRWKIENQGFNAQKNGGYNLEHAYSRDENTAKNFYFLLQIAHLLAQLIEKSRLFPKPVAALFGSSRAFAIRLLEAFRNAVLDAERLASILSDRFQVRFNTS